MKIAFTDYAFTMQNYGGISRYFERLAYYLNSLNQEVKIFGGVYRNGYISSLPEGIVKGLKIYRYPPKTTRLFHFLNTKITQSQIEYWQPHIIHETYYTKQYSVKARAMRITTAYDMIHEIFPNNFKDAQQTTFVKKETFNRADRILSISQSTKNDLINLFGIEEEKIAVVPLGIDLDKFKNRISNNLELPEDYILFVGSRSGYKNFKGLIKACSRSKAIKNKIKIIAFGGGSFEEDEIKMIKEYGFKEGFISQMNGNDDKLISLYQNALCFVYPSKYEGFGLPPLEAMASKCPVVSSNTSSMPEVINNAASFFNPNNIDEMCFAIESVLFDESLKRKLIDLGSINISKFSWHKCAENTLNEYRKVLL